MNPDSDLDSDPDPHLDADPDPAIFVIDLQEANKKQVCTYQCSGSMNVWFGSGTADPCL